MQLVLATLGSAPVALARGQSNRAKCAAQPVPRCSSMPHCRQVSASAAAGAGQRRRVVAQAAATAQAEEAPAAAATSQEVLELKMALLDSFWGTDRGLAASSDSRAEINELITQLEARNPTPEPNEARAALGGSWRLAYTSNSELIALLALGRLPLVRVGEITQTIDADAMTVENRVELAAPLSKTALSATAKFEVRSPKLLQVSFEEGRVSTPQLLADLALPSSLELMGQQVDLAPLQAALQPVEGQIKSVLEQLGGLLSSAPDLRIPIPTSVQASSWLLNTYLDDSLRITRGDGGSVFVMVRDAAPAATSAMATNDWDALADRNPPAAAAAGAAAGTAAADATIAAAAAEVVVVEGEPDGLSNGSW